jgi:hypothetical protein
MRQEASTMKARDIPPTTLRLDPELRDELMRQATINGRSLSKEIELRLRDSLAAAGRAYTSAPPVRAEEAPPKAQRAALSDHQRQLLSLFDTLTPDRQLALLTLLRR